MSKNLIASKLKRKIQPICETNNIYGVDFVSCPYEGQSKMLEVAKMRMLQDANGVLRKNKIRVFALERC